MSQLSNHDQREMKNGLKDTQLPSTSGQRKYRSEQNLVSPDVTNGGKSSKRVPKAKLRVISEFFGFSSLAGRVMQSSRAFFF